MFLQNLVAKFHYEQGWATPCSICRWVKPYGVSDAPSFCRGLKPSVAYSVLIATDGFNHFRVCFCHTIILKNKFGIIFDLFLKMKFLYKILPVVLTLCLFQSCLSITRFTSENKTNKTSKDVSSNNNTKHTEPIINNYNNSYLTLNEKQRAVLNEADKWVGTRYCYGGEDENCVDCSGFVQNVFMRVGVNLPRTAQLQYNYTMRVSPNEVKPADLVFFKSHGVVNHVGIYIGNSEFIHASTSNGVIHDNLERYSTFHTIAGYGRALR